MKAEAVLMSAEESRLEMHGPCSMVKIMFDGENCLYELIYVGQHAS